jgi:hypothetical protein
VAPHAAGAVDAVPGDVVVPAVPVVRADVVLAGVVPAGAALADPAGVAAVARAGRGVIAATASSPTCSRT